MIIDGLKVDALACTRGETRLFQSLSFVLLPGEGLFVRGLNGAGKSSLLRLLAGLLHPSGGRIAFGGQPIGADLHQYRRALAYLGHQDGLKANETARQALEFLAKLRSNYSTSSRVKTRDPSSSIEADAIGRNDDSREIALRYMSMQSHANLPIRYLSAGQRRRVALASVLASNARLWLLDEPTTALDEEAMALVYNALRRHLQNGGMFVVATHDDPPAIDGAKTLFLMGEGRVRV